MTNHVQEPGVKVSRRRKLSASAVPTGAAGVSPSREATGRTVVLCPERLKAQEAVLRGDEEVWPGNPVFVRDLGDGVKVWMEAEVDVPEPGGAQWRGATADEVLQGLDAMFPGTVGGGGLVLGFDHIASFETDEAPMSRGRRFRVLLDPMSGESEGASVWLDFWTEVRWEDGDGVFSAVQWDGPSRDGEVLQAVVELLVLSLSVKGGQGG